MVAITRKRLNVPLAPLIAGGMAVIVALVFALIPAEMLGNLVLDSGIAALMPAAEPPLGATARAALILIGGGGIGLIVWFTLYLLIGTRSIGISGKGEGQGDAVPVLRRADSHPDAPARRPLFANQDLGTPFLEVRAPVHLAADILVPRVLPADLDMPMSAYDPRAIPAEPADWFPQPARPATPRPQVFDAGERFETFDLTPPAPPPPLAPAPTPAEPPIAPPAPKVEYDASASIHALLDRLEKGVAKNAPVAPAPAKPEGLQESLASLRRMATSR